MRTTNQPPLLAISRSCTTHPLCLPPQLTPSTLLELNSNVEWWNHYVEYVHMFDSTDSPSYDQLKKLFPSVPLDPSYLATQQHAESGALLPTHGGRDGSKWATPEEFRAALDKERLKVATFYEGKLSELRQSEDLIEDEVSSIEERELKLDAEEDVILEENEEGDPEGLGVEEGDLLLRTPTTTPSRAVRKRSSIFGRLPTFGRRSSVSNHQADIFESDLPSDVRTSQSRQRSRSIALPGGGAGTSSDTDTGHSPRRMRNRALSDLSSVGDEHVERRGSFSSVSTTFGNWRANRRGHKLGLTPVDPSTYPEWLVDELRADDVEMAGPRAPVFYNWKGNTDYATVLRIGMKKRISALWQDLYALKQYVDLNDTAFQKILKKYDKNTGNKLKKSYLAEQVGTTYPWTKEAKEELDILLAHALFLYQRVVVGGDEELAKEQLRAQLRERIVVDRETVWSQMVGDRRGKHIFRSADPEEALPAFQQRKRGFSTPLGRIARPSWISKGGLIFVFAVAVMVAIVVLQPMDRVEESNCLALLVFCTILWATEAIPLFVTSLAVPFLVVVLQVLRSGDDDDRRLPPSEATK